MYTFSPSQISAYRECARKWAFRSIAKISAPQAPSAALGTETHKQLETYLAGGALDYTRESGYIAAAGIHLLPRPQQPGLLLEGYFKFQSPNTGFFYNGYRDFYLAADARPEGRPLVGDHKTTSNLSWAKKPQDLMTDPQAIIYARNEDTQDVDLLWVYYQTKGARKSLPVMATLSREHVDEQFAALELTTKAMRITLDESKKQGWQVTDLPPTPSSCEMYGGCPYRHICQLGPEDRLTSIFSKQVKTMEDKMTQGVQSLIDRIKASQTATEPAKTADHGPAKGKDTFTKDFINPPPMEELPAVLQPPEPAKRHRRTKAEMEAARAAEFPVAPATIPAPPSAGGFVLYIDCLPSSDYEDFAQLVEVAKKAVCEKIGKVDYRLADFGTGPGLLSVAVEDMINDGVLTGNVYLSSGSQESYACMSVLSYRAAVVIRAVR